MHFLILVATDDLTKQMSSIVLINKKKPKEKPSFFLSTPWLLPIVAGNNTDFNTKIN